MTHDIAIIGMAGRFPGAATVAEYWSNIVSGRVTITDLTRGELLAAGVPETQLDDPAYVAARGTITDPDLFDADFFGITPKEAAIMDPQHRLLLQTAWEALESGNLTTENPFGRVGVFAGAGFNYYLLNQVLARPEVVDTHGLLSVVLGNEKDHLAAKVAYRLNLGGPAITVQTACSTSLVAVHLACQSLRAGDSDIALAGGACVAVPQQAGYLYETKGITSPDGSCRPFDADAEGTVPGNGVAMVALKRAEDAYRDGDTVYAVIKGSAINNDGGAKVGYTAPGITGQIDVLTRAYQDAGVDPATVGYLEAHGTATEMGDAIELSALREVFTRGSRPCSLGSVKANIGHLDAAAGVAGLIKAALALRHGQIPPLAALKQARPELLDGSTPFTVDPVGRAWEPAEGHPRRAGVSSFGLGGTNAHVVLEEHVPAAKPAAEAAPAEAVLTLSARTPEALREAADRLAAHLRERPDLDPHDVAMTLQSHRRHFAHRLAVPAIDVPTALARLGRAGGREQLRRPKIVFLLPGQGAESPGMARGAYERYPSFAADIDRGAEQLRDLIGVDLRDVLLRDDPDGLIHRTDITQPALVLHEYALGRLLLSWGIRPSALIGHSVGEFAAAALAGELDLDDALRLVAARGQLMQDAPEGGMVVVMAGEAEVWARLADLPDLDVAAVNAPEVTVVAGPVPALDALRSRLDAAGVAHRTMPARRAFHSRMMADAAADLGREAATVAHRPRTCEVISSVDGATLPRGQARDSAYWQGQLRSPVRFRDAVLAAADLANVVFVEVGPGTALSGMTRQIPEAGGKAVVSLQPRRTAREGGCDVLAGAGTLWSLGVAMDWEATRTGRTHSRVTLPTYPFARTRHWLDVEPAPVTAVVEAAEEADSVLDKIIAQWRSLLGSADVTADTSFFEVGGESLLFIRMVSQTQRKFGVTVSVAELSAAPTPRALAAQIAEGLEG
ncbi:Acyl transferase domain-containing protein [Actinokineospora alba]|uniref:Acyl transferase domain-containing protein n=1 Tax=Actinokineospora alba TaxID=504798 RepID=A0A1H0FB65_9PSEU|nr:type I polyketide synthase [Actinokineospora alba]TDP69413.1 acyl transferase domain-containing protein [Actinokineospora alba]SDI17284.1 Acyl transferase domain-containing protein [Actinokineospora alba]SDN91928.1 Acyl transferase domain-containing protein [Actinokineospora alba]